MGVLSFIKAATDTTSGTAIMSAIGSLAGMDNGYARFVDSRGLFEDYVLGMSPEDMYRTQPYFRTVVSFLARNVAQLGIHTFERRSDTDRRRERNDPLARLLRRPNPHMTTYELVYRLVADLGTYDEALWIFDMDLSTDSGWRLQPIPPSWIVRFDGGDMFGPDTVWIQYPGSTRPVPVSKPNYIHFHGWDPANLTSGSAPISALKSVLSEQIHAVKYREQIWRRAGRVGITVTRPGGATWTPDQKKAFKAVLDAKLSGDAGTDAGGSLILEDGMTLKREGFSAHEEQFVEHAKLALATVAQVFHVNPTMIGQLDNANFSNVREFNRSLYTNTLGPILKQIEDKLNAELVPMVARTNDLYLEFNVEAKLRGSFEEQSDAIAKATGRPYQTVNESRALRNLPPIEGGDGLFIPLNGTITNGDVDNAPNGTALVLPAELEADAPKLTPSGYTPEELEKLVNTVASLIRSGFKPEAALVLVGLDPVEHLGLLPVTIQRPTEPAGDEVVDEELQDALKSELARRKALPVVDEAALVVRSKDRAGETYEANTARILASFFARQGKAVLAALGAKADGEWWDGARWDRELGDDLYKLAVLTATKIGRDQAAALGFEEGDYDQDRTLKFLRAVADSRAKAINGATLSALEEVLADPDGDRAPADVFTDASAVRAVAGAAALVTTFSAFATVEAGKQLGGGSATKTWRTNSKNSRPEHSALDGQTVGIEEKFSNGADWPGDPTLGADGVSGCKCSVEVTLG